MRDHEDVRAQSDRLLQARLDLKVALDMLAATAKQAARGTVGVEEVYGQVNVVRRAEEAVDLAQLDLDTARGADA